MPVRREADHFLPRSGNSFTSQLLIGLPVMSNCLSFVKRLATGRRLVITSYHDYAACGEFHDLAFVHLWMGDAAEFPGLSTVVTVDGVRAKFPGHPA